MYKSAIVNSEIQTFGVLYLMGSGNTARHCRVIGNTLGSWSGNAVQIADGSTLANSLIYGNVSTSDGAGVEQTGGNLINCTIVKNTATSATGGGLIRAGGFVTNCIVYGNTAYGGVRNYVGDANAVSYSCASELTAGVQHNIADAPLFVDQVGGDRKLPAEGQLALHQHRHQSVLDVTAPGHRHRSGWK